MICLVVESRFGIQVLFIRPITTTAHIKILLLLLELFNNKARVNLGEGNVLHKLGSKAVVF